MRQLPKQFVGHFMRSERRAMSFNARVLAKRRIIKAFRFGTEFITRSSRDRNSELELFLLFSIRESLPKSLWQKQRSGKESVRFAKKQKQGEHNDLVKD